jgi:predicted AAA+ superfamily ATPase
MKYIPRIVDSQLTRMLEDLPAVAVDGPKGVGKTSTAAQLAQTVINLDMIDERELAQADPTRLDRLPKPLLIDEWQLLPSLWDRIRRSVDAGAHAGSFILTGSATPTRKPMHTGAGRIVRLRLRPMTLPERQICRPTVSLGSLLNGNLDIGGDTDVTLDQYAEEITATGFPAIRALPSRSRADVLDGYLSHIIERDFPEAGHLVRRPTALRAWLRSYAAATSSTTSYSQILDSSTPGESEKPSKVSTTAYRDTLERMWLLEPLPAWGGHNHLAALTRSPKHHLADPGLAARLLGINASSLLDSPNPDRPVLPRVGTLCGALFESLVTLSVQVFVQANQATVSYFRTQKGTHEVDLIVERDDGRILPIEVKLASTVDDRDVRHLLWLKQELPTEVIDTVIVTTGKAAYRRADGVAVVPLALLGV